MRTKLSGVLVVAAMALAMIVGTSTKADAAFIAYICNDAACLGGGDVIVTDNAAGDALSRVNGQILIAGAVGGLTTTVNNAQSKPLIGSASSPSMDLNFSATGIGEVWFYASDTSFTGVQNGTLLFNGNASGTSTESASAWWDPANGNLALTNLICTTGNLSGAGFAGACSGAFGQVGAYALTIGVHVIRTTAGTTTGDELLTVPEPATMTLFGLGMLGFGLATRRRRAARG